MPGMTASYSWQFVSRPTGSSATLLSGTTLTPTFVADAVGTYVIALDAQIGDEIVEDTVTVEVTSTGVPIGSGIAAYTYTTNTDHIIYVHDVGHAELVSYDPATAAKTVNNIGAFTPRSIAIDDTSQTVAVGGPGIVVTASAINLAYTSRAAPGCTAAHVTAPTQMYRVDCFPEDGTIEPISSVNMSSGVVTQVPCPVKYPSVALSGGGRMYMVDGASSEVYVYDAWSTPPLPVLMHGTVPGVTAPVITPFTLTGNGLAINGDLSVAFDLHMKVSAGAYAWNGELAVVSGAQLKLFDTGIGPPVPKFSAVLPSVNGETPTARLVVYSNNVKRLFIVAGTSAGDVLYTVPR